MSQDGTHLFGSTRSKTDVYRAKKAKIQNNVGLFFNP